MKKHKVNYKEFEDLKEMGCKVIQFKPWHFRVRKNVDYETEVFVDIWPTRKKICLNKDGYFRNAMTYNNLLETVETICG